MNEQILKSFHSMNSVLRKKVLVYKSISESTMSTILRPIQCIEEENKQSYIENLEKILRQNEEEKKILQEAEKLIKTYLPQSM